MRASIPFCCVSILPPLIPFETCQEPKSGTGFMYEWATSAIAHACTYLTRAYGEGSCWIEWDFKNRTLIFDPALGTSGAAVCPCEDFKRYSPTSEDQVALDIVPKPWWALHILRMVLCRSVLFALRAATFYSSISLSYLAGFKCD